MLATILFSLLLVRAPLKPNRLSNARHPNVLLDAGVPDLDLPLYLERALRRAADIC